MSDTRNSEMSLKAWSKITPSQAAYRNNFDALKRMQGEGVDLEARDQLGRTPMNFAVANNSIEALEWLIEQGGDLATLNSGGKNLIHDAAIFDHVEMISFLQARGLDINARDDRGRTPLHHAALENRKDATRWLCQNGADFNLRDSDGQTPLHAAASTDSLNAMEVLHENGADLGARNHDGCNALDIARNNQAHEICDWLRIRDVDPGKQEFAARNDPTFRAEMEILKKADGQGFDLDARNASGRTLMHRAAAINDVDSMQWLKEQRYRTMIIPVKRRSMSRQETMPRRHCTGWVHISSRGNCLICRICRGARPCISRRNRIWST